MRDVSLGLEATPTQHALPLRPADFSNLAEALDYAAQGETGTNFYNGRGQLYSVLPYATLRVEARALALRLLSTNVERGSRVALIAETNPDFLRFFFACQYAGLVPVPLPIPINLGTHRLYVDQLRNMMQSSGASLAMAPTGFFSLLREAANGLGLAFVGDPAMFDELPAIERQLYPLQATELAYLQYTSGSTRFPRGVMIPQETVLNNLGLIVKHGVKMTPNDRCFSWLPFYHDMGLVGLVLVPMTSQVSVDFLGTREFAMRPRQWIALMARNKATISFGPPFGYELAERRMRPGEAEKCDLSNWRVAGIGAEVIRPETLLRFAKALQPAGFHPKAFTACYGMAECSLAISFAPLNLGLSVDHVDADYLASNCFAKQVEADRIGNGDSRVRGFVNCGSPLPGFEVEIRDSEGEVLPDRRTGTIFLRGPSVMAGYFGEPEMSQETLSEDGWLNTGDIGYRIAGDIVISGRMKDLIIINGRNIWPQDIEHLAEEQIEIRPGDALAFAAPGADGQDVPVAVLQCRSNDEEKRAGLVRRLKNMVRKEIGIELQVELVPLHTLPRTSSGKLSRAKARKDFIESHRWDHAEQVFEPLATAAVDQRRTR